jgi:O-antigen/teichoic acid export membrane protein
MQDAYVASVRIMAFLVFPACFGIAAIMPALLPMLYGPAFAPAINAATILVTASAFGAAATTTVIYLLAMERTGFNVATGIAGAILTVGAGLLIVPIYGAEGAALARAVIQLAIVAAAVWYVTQRLDARVPYAALGRILLAAAGCGAAARLSLYVVSPHGTNGAAALAVAVPVGVFVYVAAIRLLRALPDADLDRIATALSLLPRALRPIAERALGFLRASSATAWGGLQPETIEKRISSHD